MKKGDIIIWICTAIVFICTLSSRTTFTIVCSILAAIVFVIDIIRIIVSKKRGKSNEE